MPTLEERYSKQNITFPITTPLNTTEEVDVTWDIIDNSTANYAKLIQEYDIGEIIKSFVLRYEKTKRFGILPKPGNIDLSDKILHFDAFYSNLESTKSKYPNHDLGKATQEELYKIDETLEPIVEYIISGKHQSSSKEFGGWRSTFARNKTKKTLLGIISIDLPMQYYTPKNNTLKYKCAGTQHYVAFAFDPNINKLYIFDSASKNPNKDHSEVLYILRSVFAKLTNKHPASLEIEGLVFRNVLQPGAGDKKEEDERSYNNQNVFCHTWSLWFILVFICFYECDKSKICDPALKFIRSLSHRSPIYNLAMIKRFAGWMTTFLEDPVEESKYKNKFAIKAYYRAIENGDRKRLQEVLSIYTLAKDPYVGLNYIYNANLKQYISIEYVCRLRKVKMEIDILDSLEEVDINHYLEKSKVIRCPQAKILNPTTKRCIKVFRKY